jgi:hypothetical protein
LAGFSQATTFPRAEADVASCAQGLDGSDNAAGFAGRLGGFLQQEVMYNRSLEMSNQSRPAVRSQPVSEGAVLSKAVLGAARYLGVSNRALAGIIGLSEASVSRMNSGSYTLAPGKAFDLAVLFVRLFRALDAIAHGDEAVARAWLRHANSALGGTPLALIQSVPGLVHTVSYLDARRALV